MTKRTRKDYSAEFKREAVRLVTDEGYKIAEAARSLDINGNILGRWVRESKEGADSAFPGKGNLKKSDGLLCQGRELKFRFILVEKANYPVTLLCQVMEVSRSGFYAFLRRLERPGDAGEQRIVKVRAIHKANDEAYGSRRMSKELRAEGEDVGRYQAGTLMKKANVEVKQKKRFRVTTDSNHKYPVAPNLLDRNFDVEAPNTVWGGDITYLWTDGGWLYLAVIIDLFSRRVVGWSLSKRMKAGLVRDALLMAIWRRKPGRGLIHHSDRGSQYACHEYQDILKEHGMLPSMSRKGDCWDAVIERFFHGLKGERTHHRRYSTREAARQDVINYIEMFYNSRRLHSYLGYVSPVEYEKSAEVA